MAKKKTKQVKDIATLEIKEANSKTDLLREQQQSKDELLIQKDNEVDKFKNTPDLTPTTLQSKLDDAHLKISKLKKQIIAHEKTIKELNEQINTRDSKAIELFNDKDKEIQSLLKELEKAIAKISKLIETFRNIARNRYPETLLPKMVHKLLADILEITPDEARKLLV